MKKLTKTVTGRVTQADIDSAQRKTKNRCAYAQMLYRVLGEENVSYVNIDYDQIAVSDRAADQRLIWPTPQPVEEAVRGFDGNLGNTPDEYPPLRLDPARAERKPRKHHRLATKAAAKKMTGRRGKRKNQWNRG